MKKCDVRLKIVISLAMLVHQRVQRSSRKIQDGLSRFHFSFQACCVLNQVFC